MSSEEKVKIVVGNSSSQIIGLKNQKVIDAVSRHLSYVQDSSKYSFAVKMGNWDGRVRLLTRKQEFPSGLVELVVKTLTSFKIEVDIEDKREPVERLAPLPWHGYELRDYQKEVVDTSLFAGRGMIKSCTGSGKSNMIAALCGEYNVPAIVYVVSLDLLGQMESTITKALGVKVGVVGGGRCEIEQITVCSVWSAAKAFDEKAKNEDDEVVEDKWSPSEQQKKDIKDMVQGAKLVILDEAQFAAAASIQTLMKYSNNAVHRFGFSGTPWRGDGADILLQAAFGNNICDITASQLIERGWLVEPKIAFKDVPYMECKKQWGEVRAKYLVHNKARNKILIDGVSKLLELGRKPLILFRVISHGEILRDMLPPDIKFEMVTGALSIEDRDRIRQEFTDGKIDLLLASSVYDQGVDLPALDALVLAGGGKSTAKALQRIGRVIRGNPGKKDALILETWDQCHFVKKHSLARYNAYKYEPRFIVSSQAAMKKELK